MTSTTELKQNSMYWKYSPIVKYQVAWFDLPAYEDERDEYIQTGIHPCIVVSNNGCNRSKGDVITVIPVTSSMTKASLPTHYLIDEAAARRIGLKKASIVQAEGITSISKRRMLSEIGVIKDYEVRKHVDAVMLTHLELAYLLR